jgi:hypothetical protein|uniref:cDNA FLJ36032 fis, clone TESTI2017069 n=1 Tax=Homo sapiens TaxID=9606 RepID=Q8N9Z1_HUMAN|nr:unnamed protein product [Homo sapiens]
MLGVEDLVGAGRWGRGPENLPDSGGRLAEQALQGPSHPFSCLPPPEQILGAWRALKEELLSRAPSQFTLCTEVLQSSNLSPTPAVSPFVQSSVEMEKFLVPLSMFLSGERTWKLLLQVDFLNQGGEYYRNWRKRRRT